MKKMKKTGRTELLQGSGRRMPNLLSFFYSIPPFHTYMYVGLCHDYWAYCYYYCCYYYHYYYV